MKNIFRFTDVSARFLFFAEERLVEGPPANIPENGYYTLAYGMNNMRYDLKGQIDIILNGFKSDFLTDLAGAGSIPINEVLLSGENVITINISPIKNQEGVMTTKENLKNLELTLDLSLMFDGDVSEVSTGGSGNPADIFSYSFSDENIEEIMNTTYPDGLVYQKKIKFNL